MKDITSTLNKRTKIELGLIIAILSMCGGLTSFAFKAYSMVQSHEASINEMKVKIEKIDQISNDVAFIRGIMEGEKKNKE